MEVVTEVLLVLLVVRSVLCGAVTATYEPGTSYVRTWYIEIYSGGIRYQVVYQGTTTHEDNMYDTMIP